MRLLNPLASATRSFIAAAVSSIAMVGIAGSALAQDAIPSFTVLDCKVSCGKFIPAQPIDTQPGRYPDKYIGLMAEAVVDLSFKVTADGHVADVLIERVIGAKDFAYSAKAAVEGWTFNPATLDGKPVEQSNVRQRYNFQLRGPDGDRLHSARESVGTAFSVMKKRAAEGNIIAAILDGETILSEPVLNLYERSMISYVLAQLYQKNNQQELALERIRDVTIDLNALDKPVQEAAIRARIQLEAHAGQLADALNWYQTLSRRQNIPLNDPVIKLASEIEQIVHGSDPVATLGKIPAAEAQPSWQFSLFRRAFSFDKIVGKLDRFELRCSQHAIASPITDQAEWTIPNSWGGCILYVFGTADTSFRVLSQ